MLDASRRCYRLHLGYLHRITHLGIDFDFLAGNISDWIRKSIAADME